MMLQPAKLRYLQVYQGSDKVIRYRGNSYLYYALKSKAATSGCRAPDSGTVLVMASMYIPTPALRLS